MSKDIERLFYEDIREKKKAGNGVYSRTGRGVKHGLSGALRTPYFYMSQKEKNRLNGEVETMNMYQSILPLNEFILKEKEMQYKLLTTWRENHNNKLIMEQMGIKGAQKFADLMNQLGVPKKKTKTGGRAAKVSPVKGIRNEAKGEDTPTPELIAVESPTATQEKPEIRPQGLTLTYNGDYNAEQLQKLFTKLQLLTDGEECKFRLFISLEELND